MGSKGLAYPGGEVERTASAVDGRDLRGFFDRYVRGVGSPAFERLLPAFGWTLREKPEKDADGETPTKVRTVADFGWKTKAENGRLVVAEAWTGLAAYEAGLSAGDELVALAGVKASEDELLRLVRDGKSGTRVEVAVFRRGRLLTIPLTLGARRAFAYEIVLDENAARDARRLGRGWLGPAPG